MLIVLCFTQGTRLTQIVKARLKGAAKKDMGHREVLDWVLQVDPLPLCPPTLHQGSSQGRREGGQDLEGV